jgi:hypothetical protein
MLAKYNVSLYLYRGCLIKKISERISTSFRLPREIIIDLINDETRRYKNFLKRRMNSHEIYKTNEQFEDDRLQKIL